MTKPIFFNRKPTSEPTAERELYAWVIGPLTVEVFRGATSGEFYWTAQYDNARGFSFGPVSDQEQYGSLRLAIHAAESAIVLLKLALEAAARHPSQPPSAVG